MLKRFSFLIFITLIASSTSADTIYNSKIFVEKLGKEVVEKVSNTAISDEERHANFKKLYLSSFDNYYISRFVLGRYWKTIDKRAQIKFVESFNKYIVDTYAPKFKGWEGTFKATDSLIENNYYNVKMDILNKEGPTLKMIWKMYLNKNKEFKILDVNIDGISMLITQRAEFLSVIKNNPNGVNGLIEALNKKNSG
ncbi:MAG: phospholipid-binding protein MlaC [Alphaproteobacteria bacterium]|tara:strand:+ start:1339 stop:1926 length:588 start_codon:yes stop_codon:yes gene_type:complete